MKPFKAKGIEVIIYEPAINESEFFRSKVTRELDSFKEKSDMVVSYGMARALADVADKVC